MDITMELELFELELNLYKEEIKIYIDNLKSPPFIYNTLLTRPPRPRLQQSTSKNYCSCCGRKLT